VTARLGLVELALESVRGSQLHRLYTKTVPPCRGSFGEEVLRVPWHLALFDEAHILKNPNTAVRLVLGCQCRSSCG
jgi:hypothetical protein